MPTGHDLKRRYDVVVIGGGVHGAATAMEAARTGRDVLLVERNDFCSGASANSLRIIHGGLRYLQSADLLRSRESAREQRALMRLAPHLVKPLPCLMGADRSLLGNRAVLSLGVKFYDVVVCAGLGPREGGRWLPVAEAERLAGFQAFGGCSGALLWHDAQVTDSERLVVSYLKTAERAGADIRNYTEATAVARGANARVSLRDSGGAELGDVEAGCVIDTASMVAPHTSWSRAVNLVLSKQLSRYTVGRKLTRPSPDAGRLFFATPLEDRLIVGTWYFPDREEHGDRLSRSEYQRCIADVRDLLPGLEVTPSDVSRVHLGRLPVAERDDPLSLLEKPLIVDLYGDGRVIAVTGVKYTTARPTARRALDRAGLDSPAGADFDASFYGSPRGAGSLEAQVEARLEGHIDLPRRSAVVRRLGRRYGTVALDIVDHAECVGDGFECIPGQDAIRAEIDYCIDAEYCRTLADFLLRRSGIGPLARPADETLRYAAAVMADRLGWSEARITSELQALDDFYDDAVEPD